MDTRGNKALKSKPQEILAIVITKGHADKNICPSKENSFTYVKNRYDLPVLMLQLGLVVTKKNKYDHKDSLAEIIRN